MNHNIRLDFDSPAVFSLSSMRTAQQVISELSITNEGDETLELSMEIFSEPAFFAPQTHPLGTLAPKSKRIFPELEFAYDRTLFIYMQETTPAQIFLRVLSQDGKELLSQKRNCDLLCHDAWGGVHFAPELLACLVTPQQMQIQDLTRRCRQILSQNDMPMVEPGYLNSMNLSQVRAFSSAVFSAVYDVLRDVGVIFAMQPPELTRRGAPVQLPENTLEKKKANALDVAVLYASCVESLGLHPVILLSASRILIGGLLEPKYFAAPIMDSVEVLQEALNDGALCLFEANSLAKGTSVGFSTACKIGDKICRDLADFYFVLDLYACREQNILPLDNRVLYEDGIHFEKPGLLDEDDVFSNDTAIEEASPVPFAQNLRNAKHFLADFSPYNPLIAHPQEERVRILLTEPERLFERLSLGAQCPLFGTDASFGYRLEETQAALMLDLMEKKTAALPTQHGEICLCFGTLRWTLNDARAEAPLFLLPLKFQRQKGRIAAFSPLCDAPKINTTLLYFLNEFYGIDLSVVREIRADDLYQSLKRAFFSIRSELAGHAALTLLDQEAFFALFQTTPNDQLNALNSARLEAHPFARAVCAMEPLVQPLYALPEVVDSAPVALPTPYPMDRCGLDVCATVANQSYTLVEAPAGGGKSRLGVALAFGALNHTDRTVLYVTGEHANARDLFKDLAKAGLDDLANVLSYNSPSEVHYKMRETEMFPAEEYYTLSGEFSDAQKKLLSYEKILSERMDCGITAEEAIYCFDHVRSACDCLHFSPEKIGQLDEKTVDAHQMIIRNLTQALSAITAPANHPLRYVKTRGFSYEIKAEAVRLLDEYTKKLKEYVMFLGGSCAGIFPKAKISNESQEKAFLELLSMMGEGRGINPCFFEREIASSDLAKAETVFQYGRDCFNMRQEILSVLKEQAFDLNVKEMIIAWRDADLKKGGARKKVQKEIAQRLSAFAVEKKEFNVLDLLYQLEKHQNYKNYLQENAALVQRMFGFDILAPQNDTAETWESLIALAADCSAFDRFLARLSADSREDAVKLMKNFTQEEAARNASLYEAILELRGEMEEIRDRFVRYLDVDLEAFYKENRETLYNNLPKLLKEISGGMESFQQWTEWLNAADVARDNGFEQILDCVEAGQITGENLEDAYARAFFGALCEYVFLKHPVLNELRGAAFEEQLQELVAVRERIYDLAGQDIRAKHLRRYTSFVEESGFDVEKEPTLTPSVFARNTYALTCRYPILVANARDAVRFLDQTPARFSLLILDDAQTITLPSALALLPRAEKVVALSTRFTSNSLACLDSGEDLFLKRKAQIIPSFWDAALKTMKPMSLMFSRQRTAGLLELICTSSKRAYSAFPYAQRSPGVRTIKTPGRYDPVTFVNLPEAIQTVEEILALMKQSLDENAPLSLGVCASTKMQKLLILQTLAKRLREQPELYDVLREAKEPFYVASIQEEPIGRRDVILWSMTVAPTKNTNVPTKAFPLICDRNASRRIGSLISAARVQLCVLHSIHRDSIGALRLCTDAQASFRRVADLIFSPSDDVRSVTDGPANYDHPIADCLATHLAERGYCTTLGLRCGSFLVDLVAYHPQQEGFALAVLLDESVSSVCHGHVLGEVDLMRELSGRGFTVCRVRATDWFESDQVVLEQIFALLPDKGKNKA